MQAYKYRPLAPNSIRVLVLHPSLDACAPITCTIIHIQHHRSRADVAYEALSYTWGDATSKHPIYLSKGQEELLVGLSCHDALRHLRLEEKDRVLWIDAICINQEDSSERTDQVNRMDLIYESAERVVVYLGESTPGSEMLFQELVEIERRDRVEGFHRDAAPPSDEITRECNLLCQRPWFIRVWVLQEVHQKRSVIVMCGSCRVSMETLFRCISEYKDTAPGNPGPYICRLTNERKRYYASVPHSLWERLDFTRENQAIDAWDKVFALKSLISDGREAMDHLIDYIKSVEEVYVDTAMFLLPELGLKILTGTRHPHARNMPSWVPDWSQRLPLHSMFASEMWPISKVETDFLRKGEFSTQPVMHKECASVALHVKGVRYAKVPLMSPPFKFNRVEDADAQMLVTYGLPTKLRTFAKLKNIDPANKSCHLATDILDAMNKLDGIHLFAFLNRYNGLTQTDTGMKLRRVGYEHQYYDYYSSLQHCRIGLLDNGQLSIVPDDTYVGDTIYILNGGYSPCVLRQIPDGYWKLVSGDSPVSDPEYSSWDGFNWCKRYTERHSEDIEVLKLL